MITIGICTYQRNQQLAELLVSCKRAIAKYAQPVSIIIVENGPAAGASDVAASFSDHMNIHYYHEPRIGLTFARNAVVEQFLKNGSEWLASVDDDDLVDENWLTALRDTSKAFPAAKAFFGPTVVEYAETTPRALRAFKRRFQADGARAHHGGTGNAMFHRTIFSDDGLAMRFDPYFNFIGAEDADLIYRLRKRKVELRYSRKAKTYSKAPRDRSTIGYMLRRWRHQTHSWGKVLMRHEPWGYARLVILGRIFQATASAITYSALGAIVIVGSETKGLQHLMTALCHLCRAGGFVAALFRPLKTPYAPSE